ncbi:MAG: type II toxin-antitoxin system Phd/YefM family antitoxin [Chloroflexaceae bacterium]|nr:type II toxin-antitoxin system Phd/YefM family antitoxin [Chloroflexaceae bacterium]
MLLNIFEVDISLNEIINEIAASQSEAIVMRNGSPVARILLLTTTSPQSHYPLRGKPITIAGDFDEPMPDLWDALAE